MFQSFCSMGIHYQTCQNHASTIRKSANLRRRSVDEKIESIECSMCNKTFASKIDLFIHNKNDHKFICLQCGDTFKDNSDLDTHRSEKHFSNQMHRAMSIANVS